ncbi:MAG: HEPN domain-containing protein [Anaerolineae bacterium]
MDERKEDKLGHLTERERAALASLLERLRWECPGLVQRVLLFGSKARGDGDPDSDLDLLIVTADGSLPERILAQEEDEILLSPLILSEESYLWHQRVRDPLYVNLRRDGIELWDEEARRAEEESIILSFTQENEGKERPMDEAGLEVVKLYVEKARRNIQVVRALQENGFSDVALARAYFAAFYALVAALYVLGIVRGKHSAVLAALSKFLIKPGLIEEEYKDIYHRLYKFRQTSDYEPRYWPTPEETAPLLDEAEKFVARMEKFLREGGVLKV